MTKSPMVGAVAYTANVVEIWEGIRDYFAGTESEMDFVLYSHCNFTAPPGLSDDRTEPWVRRLLAMD